MAPARPRWVATTAGEVTITATRTGAEATAATPALEEPTEDTEEEEDTEEQAEATEEATGMWAGAAGSETVSPGSETPVQWSIPTSTKVCFLPKFLPSSFPVCMPFFWFVSTSMVL